MGRGPHQRGSNPLLSGGGLVAEGRPLISCIRRRHRGREVSIGAGRHIVALVGANGAGKTACSRPYRASSRTGTVTSTAPAPAEQAIRWWRRASCVPEGRRIFSNLTVYENLLAGAYTRWDMTRIKQDLARVYKLFPCLSRGEASTQSTLSGGERQMLAIGRALMSRPQISW